MKKITLIAAGAMLLSSAALAGDDSSKHARSYIISPADGAVVSSPFKVTFGLEGMGVAPAGVDKAKTGHHHLIINTQLKDYKTAIPKDKQHRHFGGGQTEAMVDLPAGKHTLQLVLGDKSHVPHKHPVTSKVITVTVK